jgi:hypothetical protein
VKPSTLIRLVALAFATGALVSPNAHAACIIPPPDMVGWWRFDNNADDVIAANHGTLQGGATISAGKVSNAVGLDGVDDYVSIPASTGLDTKTAITIDAWVNPAVDTAPVVEYSFGSANSGVR